MNEKNKDQEPIQEELPEMIKKTVDGIEAFRPRPTSGTSETVPEKPDSSSESNGNSGPKGKK